MTREESPLHARAASIHKELHARPGCRDCAGLGRVHVQVPGDFRVKSVPCSCARPQAKPAKGRE